jgi:hypothetical protein
MPESPQPGRPSACEWTRAALLSANLAWTTLCLGGFLPGTKLVTVVLTAALVVAHFGDAAQSTRAHPAGWLLLPFLAYAAANAAWVSPFHWLAWADWLNWAQAIAVFWITLNGIGSRPCRILVCSVLASLGVVSAFLAAYQHFVNPTWIMLVHVQADQFIGRSTGPFGIPNSLGVFMAVLIPPAAALVLDRARGTALRVASAAALAAFGVAFVLAVSRGAWISLAVAFAVRPLLSPGRGPLRRIVGMIGVLCSAAAVAGLLYLSFPLMRERVNQLVADAGERTRPILWRGAWKIFEEHPALGGGAGGFNMLFEKFRPVGFRDEPVYAHCDYVNTLCDYGAVGFVLLFCAIGAIAWKCSGARGLAGAAYTGLLAFGFHLLVDFHLKIPALAMVFATVSGFVTSEAWSEPEKGEGPASVRARAVALVVALAFAFFTYQKAIPMFRAEALRYAARHAIDKMGKLGVDVSGRQTELAEIREELAKAVALDPANAQAWSDKAYATSLWALVEPSETIKLGVSAEKDAGVAIGLCPLVAEFWIRKGIGLDMQRRWIEGGDCTVNALQLAPNRADTWYYQAFHLSLVPNEVGPALAAADVCLRLDPNLLLAQVLRKRLGAQLQQPP